MFSGEQSKRPTNAPNPVIAATAGGSNIPASATGATAFLEAPRTY
jgi:hypothetical protein